MACAGVIAYVLLRVYQYRASPVIDKPTEIVAEVIDLMRTNALKGERTDWPEIQELANQVAGNNGGERERDLDSALRYLVSKLGDGHSHYLSRAAVEPLLAPPSTSPHKLESIAELASMNGYPLIAMQSFLTFEPAMELAAAGHLRALLNKAVASNSCGLILDLRTNSGGNMYPMLLGVLPLLPEGLMLSFKSAKGVSTDVSHQGGEIWQADNKATNGLENAPRAPVLQTRVAVLTGPQTGSSGEMVVLAFKGRTNTRFFGLPTAGVTSANQPFPLRHGGILALATSTTLDRSGTPHPGPIQPDERIEPAGTPMNAEQAAAAWLNKSCKDL